MASTGVDVWTKGQISLLSDTEDAAASLTLSTEDPIIRRFATSTNEYLYLVSDSTIFISTNGGAWVTLAGTNNITDITSDGSFVYIAQAATNIPRKYTLGDNTTDHGFGSLTPELLQVVGGRIIGAQDNVIYELDAAGAKAASSLDYTLPLASSKWVSITAASNGIYVAANTDNTGSIYYIGINNSDGTLNAPTLAGSLPRNETINDIIFLWRLGRASYVNWIQIRFN